MLTHSLSLSISFDLKSVVFAAVSEQLLVNLRHVVAYRVPRGSKTRKTKSGIHSFQDQTESAAILKIKESMQEEAKRFEKDSDQPEYYMQ